MDGAGEGGSWGQPAPERLWLAYDPGLACDAFLPARLLPDAMVRGL